MFLTIQGELYIWEFVYEKLINNALKPTKIELELDEGDSISQIQMGYKDVFLLSYEGKVYHFKKN